FSLLQGFLHLQVVLWQNLPEYLRLPKKSCQKTYRRFYDFGELCHHRSMNYKYTLIHGKKIVGPSVLRITRSEHHQVAPRGRTRSHVGPGVTGGVTEVRPGFDRGV